MTRRRTGAPRPSERAGAGARRRPALTSRAAILAVVLCAIALSLAYPLREYFAQRSEIAQLQAERAELEDSVAELEVRRDRVNDSGFIEQDARERLHYRYPDEHAYVVLDAGDEDHGLGLEEEGSRASWFAELWRSVEAADRSSRPQGEIPDALPLPR